MSLSSVRRSYLLIVAAAIVVVFLSVFLFARVGVSIGVLTVIVLYLFSSKLSFEGFMKNSSLFYLFLAGAIINIQTIYFMVANENFHAKSIFGFSNPIFVVVYVLALIYFLSRSEKVRSCVINCFISIVSIFAIVSLMAFIYRHLHGSGFIVNDFYKGFRGGSVMQSIVAISFPLTAVMIIMRVRQTENVIVKVSFILLALIIAFIDLFANRSKSGYLIEFSAFFYFTFFLIKRYATENGYGFKKIMCVIATTVLAMSILLIATYNYSSVFNSRVTDTYNEINLFLNNKDEHQEDAKDLALASTQLRLLYYYSSFKILQTYPSVLVLGCGYSTNELDIRGCTSKLVENNNELRTNKSVLDGGVMPHDEFLNYVFKGGILAGAMLLMFFITLFREAKYLDQDSKVCLRILTMSFIIGCSFDYFITVQMIVAIFATLLGIFLSKRNYGIQDGLS